MVDTAVALSLIQLIALSLPAFAILFQVIVESDFPYANRAVPVVVVGFLAFLVAGVVLVVALMPDAADPAMILALGLIAVGLLALGLAIALMGIRTRRAQEVLKE